MKSVVIIAIAVVLFLVPISAFADVTITPVTGSGVPGCETGSGCFSPMSPTVTIGDVILFSNTDSAAHTFTAGTISDDIMGTVFDSGLLKQGEKAYWEPKTTGEFPYFCMLHPWMTGSINVKEVPKPSVTQSDPTYEFESDMPIQFDSNLSKFLQDLPTYLHYWDNIAGKNVPYQIKIQDAGFLSGISVEMYANIDNPLLMECSTTVTTSGNSNPECLKSKTKYVESLAGTFTIIEFDSTDNALNYFNQKNLSNVKLPWTACVSQESLTEQKITCSYFNYVLTLHQHDFYPTLHYKAIPKSLQENFEILNNVIEKISNDLESAELLEISSFVKSSKISKLDEQKVIDGKTTSLLVLDVSITNNGKNSIFLNSYYAFDYKLNKFSQIYSQKFTFPKCEGLTTAEDYKNKFFAALASEKCDFKKSVEFNDPSFKFDENCEKYTSSIIPNETINQKICIEIGKNSNPLIVTESNNAYEIDLDEVMFINILASEYNPETIYYMSSEPKMVEKDSEITSPVIQQTEESVKTSENLVKEISNEQGGGCLIATATYGSEMASKVQQLRELRDNSLLQTESGTAFMTGFNQFYYSFSPIIADYERENSVFKEIVKLAITPMISSLSILNYVDMDSESSVLGYGISLIILNAMMYVGIPILAIIRIRK